MIYPEDAKPIFGFEGYCASTNGKVWSLWNRGRISRMGKIWKPIASCLTSQGRKFYQIKNNKGKRRIVLASRCILFAHVGPPPEPKMWACHIDDDATNDVLSNLYWGTPKQNMEDRRRNGIMVCGEKIGISKLTEKQVLEIRKMIDEGKSNASIGRYFNVSGENIRTIRIRKTWKHI